MTSNQLPLSDQALSQWRAKGKFVKLGGHSIFVIDESTKPDDNQPVLLMIHGYPTSSWDWAPMWDTLLKDYRLVCMDMLGFGFSDKPDRRDYTIHGQADLIDELVSKLGLTKFHVLAHDYAVSVAQELLARQNQRQTVSPDSSNATLGRWLSCTFLNGGLFPETHHTLVIQKLMLSPLGKYINMVSGLAMFSASFSRVFGDKTKPSKTELAQFWEVINYNSGRHTFHNLITYILDRREHRERWVKALQEAEIPLALINGSVDPISGEHLVVRYKELNCRLDYLDELAGIGHYPQVEAPERVSTSLSAFLASIK